MSDGAFRNFCDFLERVKKTQTRVVTKFVPRIAAGRAREGGEGGGGR